MRDKDNGEPVWLGLDRRTALGLGAGALACAGMPIPAAASVGARLDPAKPEDAWRIQRKMQFRTDSGPVFWWIRGPYFAEVDVKLTPLYALNFGVIQQVSQRDDGGFDVKQLELSFRTDIDTGKRLTEFRNPLTNEVLPIQFSVTGPNFVRYSKDNIPTAPTDIGGSKMESTFFPAAPFVIGEDVFFRSRSQARVSTPGLKDRFFNDISTHYGPAKQALDPTLTWADANLQSSDVTSWPRWLNMGDKPGSVTLRGIGGKVRRFADMPSDWLDMVHELAHDIARDPIAALNRPQAQFGN